MPEPSPYVIAFVMALVFFLAIKGEMAARATEPKFVIHADADITEL